ncbi:MAG: zinc ribbon domain-containing protein [Candidatus Lokiarchaeota archaeon]|nr:zinc ribbon domain-containing protein [Candidatus Lokiarchaeota archaeon]
MKASTLFIIFSVNPSYILRDLNASVTSISFVPYSGINEVNASTLFSLIATDNSESGVSTTLYKIDDSSWISYTGAFTLSGYDSGVYMITYQSIDAVGNIEIEKSIVVVLYIPPLPPEPPNLIPILLTSIGIGIAVLITMTIFILIRRRTPKTPIKARTDEIQPSGSDQFKICPYCYSQVKINAKYCTLCGASLEKQ